MAHVRLDGEFSMSYNLKASIYFFIFLAMIISGIMFINRTPRPENPTNIITCIEHVMIDNRPYCGMIKVENKLYQLDINDVRQSVLTAEFER